MRPPLQLGVPSVFVDLQKASHMDGPRPSVVSAPSYCQLLEDVPKTKGVGDVPLETTTCGNGVDARRNRRTASPAVTLGMS